MQSTNSDSLIQRTRFGRDGHELTRRRFLKMALVSSGGLGLALAGCSADGAPGSGGDRAAAIDKWIKAVNSEDERLFARLHTDDVVFNSYLRPSPHRGRDNVWNPIGEANLNQLEKRHLFGQADLHRLQVSPARPKRSFLYVFRFEGDLIAQVHEYSAAYDLTDVPLFEGAEIVTDDTNLAARLDVVGTQLEALNERDFERFLETFTADTISYGAAARGPIRGTPSVLKDIENFAESFPDFELSEIRSFGQGNLVCQEIAMKNVLDPSLAIVHLFDGDKVAQVYQYLSNAELST